MYVFVEKKNMCVLSDSAVFVVLALFGVNLDGNEF